MKEDNSILQYNMELDFAAETKQLILEDGYGKFDYVDKIIPPEILLTKRPRMILRKLLEILNMDRTDFPVHALRVYLSNYKKVNGEKTISVSIAGNEDNKNEHRPNEECSYSTMEQCDNATIKQFNYSIIKKINMKTFYFNVQSKGGAGKSMLTYLQGLKHENYADVAFVDLDHAVKTSSTQLQFLAEKKRLFVLNIYNEQKRVDREKLFKVLETLNKLDFSSVFIDLGATESEQLLSFFEYDFNAEEFKMFEKELQVSFVFNVVVAGGTSYLASTQYLMKLAEMLEGDFEINVYANEFFFNEENGALIRELADSVARSGGRINSLKVFGKISTDTESGKTIIRNIKSGNGSESYVGYAAKTIIKREMQRV